MRSLLLLSSLLLAAPAFAMDEGAEAPAEAGRDTAAEYTRIIKLVDAWMAARERDEQLKIRNLDEQLTSWYRRELEDTRRLQEQAAAEGGKKKKKKGAGDDLPSSDDLMDTSVAKNYPRLRAVTQELSDMQDRFDRMEANAMLYMQKERKLQELRGLALAEITVAKPPPAPAVAKAEQTAETAAGEAAGGPAEAAGDKAEQAQAAAKAVQAAPKPAGIQVLDEDEDEDDKPKKAKKVKKPKKGQAPERRLPSTDDLE